jgi:hypothetical protein
MTMED